MSFEAIAGDLASSTHENHRKTVLNDASERARALLGSLKEKRDFFESRIHGANPNDEKRGIGDSSNAACPSPPKSSFTYSDMTTRLNVKIQGRQNMINRLTCSPNASFRTANTLETTESTLTPPTLEEMTVETRVPAAPSLKDMEESIKQELCVVIPVHDRSPSPELTTSCLEDSSDTQQNNKQRLAANMHQAPTSVKDTCEKVVAQSRYSTLLSSPVPLEKGSGIVDKSGNNSTIKISEDVSELHTEPDQDTDDVKRRMQALSTDFLDSPSSVSVDTGDKLRKQDVSEKMPEHFLCQDKENVLNDVKSSRIKQDRKETLKQSKKPPRPSRRGSRGKRSMKDRRKTEMALSAASVLLEPASSFEDHGDAYSMSSLKSADIPSSDYAAAGLKPPVVQEKDKIEKLAKHGLKVSQCGSQPTRYVKQSSSRPSKTRRRSVSFAIPDEKNTHVEADRPASLTTVLPERENTEQRSKGSKDIICISRNDSKFSANVQFLKGGSQNRAKEKPPVVLMQYSEDSQEDRSAFLRSAFSAQGPLSYFQSKKGVAQVSVHVNGCGVLKKRDSSISDDTSMDFTSDSNTSGWMSSSESLEDATSSTDLEDLSDLDVVIEKRNPRVTSPLASPRTDKHRIIYTASLISRPVDCDQKECLSGGLLIPELDERCFRRHKYSVPILLRPLVFASENQSDALSRCYGGMYSLSSESIVEKRIQAFERKIRPGQHVPRYLAISKDFPCGTRGSLYDIAVHSGCTNDEQKSTSKVPKNDPAVHSDCTIDEQETAAKVLKNDLSVHDGCTIDKQKSTFNTSRKKELPRAIPAKGGLYYLALSSGLSRRSIESRSSYTIFTKTSASSIIENNGLVISEKESDGRCGASGSLYLAQATRPWNE